MIFDLLLLGVAKTLLPKASNLTDREKKLQELAQRKGFGNNRRDTSMECLAFDSLHQQAKFEKEAVNYQEPMENVHRDIEDDGGPDW